MEKLWLKSYQENMPQEINPEAYSSLVAMFEEACGSYRDRNAFYSLGKFLSFNQLDELSRDFAAYLQQGLGLKKGDRVAIMLPNILQYPIALFGILRAGLVVVNVNPLYTATELTHQLNDADVSAIIVLANVAHVVEHSLANTKLKTVIVTEIGDLLGFPRKQLINFVVKYIKKQMHPYSIQGATSFCDVLEQGKKLAMNPVRLTPQDIAFLQYTGGTTGVAKAAVLTHRNMVANVEQAGTWIQTAVSKENEIIITALPLYHIFALTANCLVFLKLGALNVLIVNPRDLNAFVSELSKHAFTTITGVNTLFNGLLHHPKFAKVNFSFLKMTLGGGMAVQETIANKWKQVTGVPILEAYGLTETSPAVCINPVSMKSYNGTIGLPLPSTEISIRDEQGKELAIGERGELCVRGPQVMQGYWKKPDETAKVLSPDGWLRTGDVATVNQEGYVKIVERKKDMILVSGFNVYPNEVEAVIAGHPDVLEVAVIGIDNSSSGEAVKAFIVKKNPKLDADQIINYCRESLTGYKIPKYIEFRDELPKSTVGKILRRKLRDEEKSKQTTMTLDETNQGCLKMNDGLL